MNFAPTIQWARELIRLGLISVNSSIITKPQFLVNNFSLIQFATMKRHREKLFHFFNTKLLKKTIPPYLQVNKTIQAGVFLYAPHKNMIRSNDRVKFSDLNVVRLINS
jgi:ribosomal protein S4